MSSRPLLLRNNLSSWGDGSIRKVLASGLRGCAAKGRFGNAVACHRFNWLFPAKKPFFAEACFGVETGPLESFGATGSDFFRIQAGAEAAPELQGLMSELRPVCR